MIPASPLRHHNVRVASEGARTIVLGHGFGTDQRAWRFLAPRWEKQHRVVLFDHHGANAVDSAPIDPSRHDSLDGYAEDLLDVLAAADVRDVVYVGHSVGGIIGLLACVRDPSRFAALVLLCSSPCFLDHPPDYIGGFSRPDLEALLDLQERDQLAWASALAPMAIGSADHPLAQDFATSLATLDPTHGRRFARLVFFLDRRAEVARVPVPTLVVQCTRDRIVPPEVGAWMSTRLPRGTLARLDVTGHCPHMSCPDAVDIAVRQFMATLP